MFDLQITDMQFNDLNTQDLKYKVWLLLENLDATDQ